MLRKYVAFYKFADFYTKLCPNNNCLLQYWYTVSLIGSQFLLVFFTKDPSFCISLRHEQGDRKSRKHDLSWRDLVGLSGCKLDSINDKSAYCNFKSTFSTENFKWPYTCIYLLSSVLQCVCVCVCVCVVYIIVGMISQYNRKCLSLL